jgi:hypothetical protein
MLRGTTLFVLDTAFVSDKTHAPTYVWLSPRAAVANQPSRKAMASRGSGERKAPLEPRTVRELRV